MTFRYGLIGAGMMGREHIANVNLLEGARVVALADPDDAMRARALAAAGEGCAAHADHAAMLSGEKLDALVIASPNDTHLAVMKDALATDLPILVEKPLGLDRDECDQICAMARGRKAPVWVAMEYRYMPAITRMIEELRAGVVGRPRMTSIREHRYPFLDKVEAWNRFQARSGGTLVEKCCHFFDLMRLLMQDEPVRVFASASQDVNHLDEDYDGKRPDVVDNAYVIVDFAGGGRAMLDLCMFAEGSTFQEMVSVTGERARIDALTPGPARFSKDGGARPAELRIARRADKVETCETITVDDRIQAAGDHQGSTYHQHVRFFAAARGAGPVEVGLEDGRRAVILGAAAEESARAGLPVAIAF